MTVIQILKDFGLEACYRTHHFHGDYPLLALEGELRVDELLENVHFLDTAFYLGTYAELWGGETVHLSHTHTGLTTVEAVDDSLRELVVYHLTRAAQAIQLHCKEEKEAEQTLTKEVVNDCEEVVYIGGERTLTLPF